MMGEQCECLALPVLDERLQRCEDRPYRANSANQGGGGLIPLRARSVSVGAMDEYRGGRRDLHLHFGLSEIREVGPIELGEFCVVFNHFARVGGAVCPAAVSGTNFDFDVSPRRTDNDKTTVLVGVIEATDESEGIQGHVCGHVVGLGSLNDCPSFGVNAFEGGIKTFPRAVVTTDERPPTIPLPNILEVEREASPASTRPRQTRDDDVVQGGAEGMEELTEDHCQHRIRLGSHFEFVDPVVWLALWLPDIDGPIRVTLYVAPGFAFELYEMELCPLHFQPPRGGGGVQWSHETRDSANAAGHRDPGPDAGRVGEGAPKGCSANGEEASPSH